MDAISGIHHSFRLIAPQAEIATVSHLSRVYTPKMDQNSEAREFDCLHELVHVDSQLSMLTT